MPLTPGQQVMKDRTVKAYQLICDAGDAGVTYNELKSARVHSSLVQLTQLGMISRHKRGGTHVYTAAKRPLT